MRGRNTEEHITRREAGDFAQENYEREELKYGANHFSEMDLQQYGVDQCPCHECSKEITE